MKSSFLSGCWFSVVLRDCARRNLRASRRSYLAIRSAVPATTEVHGACGPVASEDVQFVVVPPGLVALWLAATNPADWLWPEVDSAQRPSGDFVFRTIDGEVVAHATCVDEMHCTAEFRGQTLTSSSGATIAIGDVLAKAP